MAEHSPVYEASAEVLPGVLLQAMVYRRLHLFRPFEVRMSLRGQHLTTLSARSQPEAESVAKAWVAERHMAFLQLDLDRQQIDVILAALASRTNPDEDNEAAFFSSPGQLVEDDADE